MRSSFQISPLGFCLTVLGDLRSFLLFVSAEMPRMRETSAKSEKMPTSGEILLKMEVAAWSPFLVLTKTNHCQWAMRVEVYIEA